MTAFLNYPLPDYNSKNKEAWQNTFIKDDMGKVIQTRAKGRTSPFWTVTLIYLRSLSDPTMAFNMSVFRSSLRALQGGAQPCYFYTPLPWDWWDNAQAGIGDGSTLVFPFGGCNLMLAQLAPIVFVNGTAVPQYAIGGGSVVPIWTVAEFPGDAYNRWAITWDPSAVPAVGAQITVSFMGCRLLLGSLIQDPGEVTAPGYAQESFQVVLQGEEV
ncbi:MAG: hypothetical protein ABR961_03395 [Thermoanaerobaculaceae bacterium]